jgi:hypothetical protein
MWAMGNHRSPHARRPGDVYRQTVRSLGQALHRRYDASETCDWDAGHCGPRPRYWRYFKHCACHWLVNDSLAIAKAALPVRRVQKAIEISRAE